jgi:transposase-like protein
MATTEDNEDDRGARQEATRSPKEFSDDEKAAILAEANRTSGAAAAKKYQLATRTIERWRAQMRQGLLPEVARQIAAQQRELVQRSTDKLLLTQDALLDRMLDLAPTMTTKEVSGALETVGELVLARKVLTFDAEGRPENPDASEEAGSDAGATRGASSTATGSSEPRPVH